MATYIRDDGLNSLNQTLQFLAQQNQRRKAQDLETASLLNKMGENKKPQDLLLSSQRGLLGNWFGDDAKEWTVTNPFKKHKQEIYNVNADQGGILAALIDPNSADYNPDMANLMAQGSPRTLSELSKMKEQGIMNLTPYAVQQQFQPQLQAYAENKQANNKIKAFNKKYEHMESEIGGNEELQQQKILQYAYDAIRTADTPQEQIKAYMDYRIKVKAINDHYGHQMQAESPAFFGIGSGGKGGTGKGEKPKPYNVIVNGDKIRVVGVTDSMLMDKDGINAAIIKRYPKLAKELNLENISFYLDPAGTDTGLNAKELEELKQKAIETEAALEQKMRKDTEALDVSGIDTDYAEMRAYNESMDRAGIKGNRWDLDTYGIIPYESYIAKYGKGNSNVATSNETQKTESKGKTPIYDFSTNPPKIVGYQ